MRFASLCSIFVKIQWSSILSTAASVSKLQGDFQNIIIWKPTRIFLIISDAEKLGNIVRNGKSINLKDYYLKV